MDSVYIFNKERWEALVRAEAVFTRPWLSETRESALQRIDPEERLGNLTGKDVLCLAGGGGQQSVAFALNGANVSVFDISHGQLSRDLEAARHYGYSVSIYQGDIRDLSVFEPGSFDIVSQPYSLNFVPDCRDVFAQVARVLRSGGLYTFWAANPFAAGLGTHAWNGRAYEVTRLYQQGDPIEYPDEPWVFPVGSTASKPGGPREFRHLLSTLLNGVFDAGLVLIRMKEETGHERSDHLVPGEWEHFTAVLPPWFSFLTRLERVNSPRG